MALDATNLTILELLQSDARISNAEIARRVNMAPSATLERVRKLEEHGVIKGYAAQLNPEALELGLLAFVSVRTSEGVSSAETEKALAKLPEVQELHHIAGEDCFLIKVRVRDTAALRLLLREKLGMIPSVRSTHSTIVLHTSKEVGSLPLPAAP